MSKIHMCIHDTILSRADHATDKAVALVSGSTTTVQHGKVEQGGIMERRS